MYGFHILTAILLGGLLFLGGCASKTAGNSVNASSTTAPHAADSDASNANAQGEAVPVSAGATFSTLDGRKLETVYFDYDSFTLQPAARQSLDRHATWLQDNPTVRVVIEGHCDERGSDEYNLALGERRAIAVKTYLTMLGIDSERLKTISYGEENPAVEGHDEAAWSKNRRAEFK